MSFKIREAQIEDAEEIANVHCASWKSAYKNIFHGSFWEKEWNLKDRADRWAENLEKGCAGQYKLFVALDGDEIIGFADVGAARDGDMAGYAELYAIYVQPEYIGQGAGKELLRFIRQQTFDFNYVKLYVWVLDKNKTGRDFYERMGGVKVESDIKEFDIDGINYQEVKYHWVGLNE